MQDPAAPVPEALTRAAAETAELAAALAGWPAALVHFDGGVLAAAGAARGLPDRHAALARARAALAGASPAGPAVVAIALPDEGAGPGLLAVFGPAGARPPERLREHLGLLGRALAARCELAQRDTRLGRLAAHAPGVLYQFQRQPDGRMAMPYATAGLRAVFGVDPDAVRADASALFARAHPDDLPRILASIEASALRLTPWDCEYRIVRPDGVVQWHHGRATPERLADGSTLWHGFIMPVDERKRAELALQRSEESFRQFFEAGLVGMTIAEPGRRWLRVNDRMAELLGYTLQEMQGLDWAAFTHPEDLPADEANYARMAAGQIDGYVMDKRYLRKDGSVLECALAVRCERDGAGALQRVFAIVQDISERRQAERALQAQRDALEREVGQRTRELVAARDAAQQASRAKTEFLASMSHELRTPLNAILGFAQLIALDHDLAARPRAQLQEVLRAGQHLLQLINEVLDLAQVESGRLALSPEALPLATLVDDALALSAPLAQRHRVTLQHAVPAALVVRADRLRLQQVLLNLISNAIKYNRPGGRVQLLAEALGAERVRLTVRDTGIGIAPERIHQLFQPFNRLGAELGAVEGTGIGLALSRRLVELMGGRIGAESRPGQGSAFWVELAAGPLAGAPPARADAAAPPDAAGAACAALPSLVLYVEDNPANLALVEQILARHPGVRLLGAGTGPQGLALALEQRPALILLDIHLPGMDGYELLARLRADERTRAIPVVALTAQAMPSDARRILEAGFDDYIAKPIDLAAFDALVQGRLAARRP